MIIKMSKHRGRSSSKGWSTADYKVLESLALISMKYGIDLNGFINSFVEAWECQESTCESLSIKCRKKTRDNANFLITKGSKVVAQLPISKHILEKNHPLKEFVLSEELRKKIVKRIEVKIPRIKDLKLGMKRIKLKAKVIEISKERIVSNRLKDVNRIANVKIADETGSIQLPLWNNQIDTFAVGDNIQIEDAYVKSYNGKLQLRSYRFERLIAIEKV